MPRRHGRSPRLPADVHVAARLNHEIAQPAARGGSRPRDRPRSPCRCRRGARACPCASRNAVPARSSTTSVAVVDERQARVDLAAIGTVSSWSWSNFHRPDSAPKVTSNRPSVHSLTWRAMSSTSRVSALTGTGWSPAAALRRRTSLPSSRRSSARRGDRTRANTAANAASARGRRPSRPSTRSRFPSPGASARRDALRALTRGRGRTPRRARPTRRGGTPRGERRWSRLVHRGREGSKPIGRPAFEVAILAPTPPGWARR